MIEPSSPRCTLMDRDRDDNDDDGDAEMNRIEANIAANPEQLHGGDAEEQQEEVPIVPREASVKLGFRMF